MTFPYWERPIQATDTQAVVYPPMSAARTVAAIRLAARDARIHELHQSGMSQAAIAREYGISKARVWKILNRGRR